MTVLIAPDKFKGSLSAAEVCAAVSEGLLAQNHQLKVISIPLADGGEGTCELLTNFFNGRLIDVAVHDPHFEIIKANYGLSQDGTTAFIEMANASGLQLVKPEKKNPLYTTTYGTGELILHALEQGVRKVILGIGGSGTNDAGIGMAEALGFEFYDSVGKKIKAIGQNLMHLASIHSDHAHPRLKEVEFLALCDVDNPLHGAKGAAFTYAPQKGADEKTVKWLDDGLRNFEKVARAAFPVAVNFPGAGAGGGLAGGAKAFLNIQIRRGMEYILEATHLIEKISQADFIVTGEGKVDQQTLAGKVVMEVSKLALRFHKPVIVICGICELPPDDLKKIGVSKVIPLVDLHTTAAIAQQQAYPLIKQRFQKLNISGILS